jgi:hypothetical protein
LLPLLLKTPPFGGVFFADYAPSITHRQNSTVGLAAIERIKPLSYAHCMRVLFVLCLLLVSLPGQSEIYKWVDSRGEVHYSDTPSRDAEQIKLSDPTIYTPTGVAASAGSAQNPVVKAPDKINYSSFVIVVPGNNEVVQSSDGLVTVQFQIEPGLKSGHYILPVLDGTILTQKATSSVLTLNGLERGAHMLHASIYNAGGSLLSRSNIVQFFVRQTSVVEDGKSPDLPDSGSSGQSGVDAPQFKPGAAPGYKPGAGSNFKPDAADSSPGQSNTHFNPTSKPISSSPGQTNPAFKPKY